MNGAQLTMIILYIATLTVSLLRHGQPKTGKVSYWETILSLSISYSVLYWGGFWEGAIK